MLSKYQIAYDTILFQREQIQNKCPGLELRKGIKTPDSLFAIYKNEPIAQIYRGRSIIENPIVGKISLITQSNIDKILNTLQEYYK